MKKRKPNRLPDYDYSSCGAYFITVCTRNKEKLFWSDVGAAIGRPESGEYRLSEYGLIVESAINNIEKIYSTISVDKYTVMPNHIHIILLINSDESGRPMAAPTISTVINQMKGFVSKQIGFSVWQKSFYDHIIRGQNDYDEIWRYIDENPLNWTLDELY